MKKIKIKFVVAGFIQNSQDEILIAKRPLGKPMANYWEFPGGKVHENELPAVALVRELKEELGLEVECKDLYPLTFITHDYEDFHLLMLLYGLPKQEYQPESLENQELSWVRWDNIKNYRMLPADLPLIDFLEKINKK